MNAESPTACCVCGGPIDPTQPTRYRAAGRGFDGINRPGSVWHSACGPINMAFDVDGQPLPPAS